MIFYKEKQRLCSPHNQLMRHVLQLGLAYIVLLWATLGAIASPQPQPSKESRKELASFTFYAQDNAGLCADIAATINDTTITVPILASFVGVLTPTLTYSGVGILPPSRAPQDFRQPVTYTINAADGSTKRYAINIIPKGKEITALSFEPEKNKALTQRIVGKILPNGEIRVAIPEGIDRSALIPTIVHNGAQIDPPSDVAQDFNMTPTYTIVSEAGVSRTYVVTPYTPDNRITVFFFKSHYMHMYHHHDGFNDALRFNAEGAIGEDTIKVVAPTTAIQALMPVIVHGGETIEPASETNQDFSKPVVYTVTSADGRSRRYTVLVTVENRWVTIPDPNFRERLRAALPREAFNESGQLNVHHQSVQMLKTLDVSNAKISSLSGIEYFFNLVAFNGSHNALHSLSLSSNELLEKLYVQENPLLKELDISNNTLLQEIDVSSCRALKKLSLQKNEGLLNLTCQRTGLRQLDLRNNRRLVDLDCASNPLLTSLTLAHHPWMQRLRCDHTGIKTLNVAGCVGLKQLVCGHTRLKALDVQNNSALESVYCANAQIKSLDFSHNIRLREIQLSKNPIATLDLRHFDFVNSEQFRQTVTEHFPSLDQLQSLTLRSDYCNRVPKELIEEKKKRPSSFRIFWFGENPLPKDCPQ